MCSCAVRYYFSNSSIILIGFKFTELHTLTLAARSYVLLLQVWFIRLETNSEFNINNKSQSQIYVTTNTTYLNPKTYY